MEVATTSNTVKCPFCEKFRNEIVLFPGHKEVDEHIREEHGFHCDHCIRVYTKKERLENHLYTNYHQGYLRCGYYGCTVISKMKTIIDHHQKRDHKKRFPCTVKNCQVLFETEAKMKKHLEKPHTPDSLFMSYTVCGPRQYDCIACEKTFQRNDTLVLHVIRDHLEEWYKCFGASCPFLSKSEDIRNTHSKRCSLADITCKYCPLSFASAGPMGTHTCDSNQKFGPSRNENQSEPCHVDKCKHQAESKEELTRHMLMEHKDAVACGICELICNNEMAKQKHYERSHPRMSESGTIYGEIYYFEKFKICVDTAINTLSQEKEDGSTTRLITHKILTDKGIYSNYCKNFNDTRKMEEDSSDDESDNTIVEDSDEMETNEDQSEVPENNPLIFFGRVDWNKNNTSQYQISFRMKPANNLLMRDIRKENFSRKSAFTLVAHSLYKKRSKLTKSEEWNRVVMDSKILYLFGVFKHIIARRLQFAYSVAMLLKSFLVPRKSLLDTLGRGQRIYLRHKNAHCLKKSLEANNILLDFESYEEYATRKKDFRTQIKIWTLPKNESWIIFEQEENAETVHNRIYVIYMIVNGVVYIYIGRNGNLKTIIALYHLNNLQDFSAFGDFERKNPGVKHDYFVLFSTKKTGDCLRDEYISSQCESTAILTMLLMQLEGKKLNIAGKDYPIVVINYECDIQPFTRQHVEAMELTAALMQHRVLLKFKESQGQVQEMVQFDEELLESEYIDCNGCTEQSPYYL